MEKKMENEMENGFINQGAESRMSQTSCMGWRMS